MNDQERSAMKLALDVVEAISANMTVGDRWTNVGQELIDALPVVRAALEQPEQQPDADHPAYLLGFADGAAQYAQRTRGAIREIPAQPERRQPEPCTHVHIAKPGQQGCPICIERARN